MWTGLFGEPGAVDDRCYYDDDDEEIVQFDSRFQVVSHFNVTTAALNTQTGNFKVKCTYPYYSRGHQIQRKLRHPNLELAAFYANRGAAYECLERLNKEQVKELGFV